MSKSILASALVLAAAAACGPSSGGGRDAAPIDCPDGFGDCDGDRGNGCESPLDTIDACGSCDVVCGTDHAAPACVGGVCQVNCSAGYGDCDFTPNNGCEAPLDTSANCGMCGRTCSVPFGTGECVAGECGAVTCVDGHDDCNDDLADGCESDLTAPTSCGSCDNGCAGNCAGGACETCDSALALASNDPVDAARAIGLCDGVVAARWVLPDGTATTPANFDLGHGILGGFGSNVMPREGSKLLALSSGTARQPSDPGYQSVDGFDKGYTSGHPAGFPKESPACPGVVTGAAHDGIGLEVTLQVPSWAEGFSFDFDFYTYEWPFYICSEFNDFFVAMLDPIPMGQPDGNISFDSMGNPVSVNNAFLDACGCFLGPPCMAGGKTFNCTLGTAPLAGTGFEPGAATGWLVTTAPVEPDTQITLRFIAYDSGDGVLDSTTIIDGFHWLPKKPDVGTNPIP